MGIGSDDRVHEPARLLHRRIGYIRPMERRDSPMYHPLYYKAVHLMGQPVYVQHFNGRVYHGTLMAVHPDGLYLMPTPSGNVLMSNSSQESTSELQQEDLELIYSPASYFAFGALAGLGIAALATPFWW